MSTAKFGVAANLGGKLIDAEMDAYCWYGCVRRIGLMTGLVNG